VTPITICIFRCAILPDAHLRWQASPQLAARIEETAEPGLF
jgi:hypothetical protein